MRALDLIAIASWCLYYASEVHSQRINTILVYIAIAMAITSLGCVIFGL